MGRLNVATPADLQVLSLSDDFKAIDPAIQQAYIDRAESMIARRGQFLTTKEGYAEDMRVAAIKVAEFLFNHDDPDAVRMAAQGISKFSAGSYSQSNDGKVDIFQDPEVREILSTYLSTSLGGPISFHRDTMTVENDLACPPLDALPWGGVKSGV